MTEISDRYRRVAGAFTERAKAVPDGAWDNPAPCEGWVARATSSGTWWSGCRGCASQAPASRCRPCRRSTTTRWAHGSGSATRSKRPSTIPRIAAREFDMQVGRFSVENAVDTFCTNDVLVHTWDLARDDAARRNPRRRRGAPHVRGDAADGRGVPRERSVRRASRCPRRRRRTDQAHRLHRPSALTEAPVTCHASVSEASPSERAVSDTQLDGDAATSPGGERSDPSERVARQERA